MIESWKINRAGVVNFWYYDEETFQFENGRLLLRGSNGSGKSVTMQSLVPLLFDGNKSPERLDPFGSRARKMDNYLLSDGLDLEERTGYLFLEFAKENSKRYLSIGMGMRARKNKPLQTWYFIVLDNRRIGFEDGMFLYKDIGDKIPLTQKELENRIGDGGHVYDKQGDYKNAVNEYLFGYSDVTDFEELIELLIQIRSPKLSKEFKPTTMYEILQNSLVTLNDDDLRPMSEAIENMDDISLKIDALKSAKKAATRIGSAYKDYNEYLLYSKAKRLLDKKRDIAKSLKEVEGLTTKRNENENVVKVLQTEVESLNVEKGQLEDKESRLKEHDLTNLFNELENLKLSLDVDKKAHSQKNDQLDKFIQKEMDIRNKIRESEDELYRTEKSIDEKLDGFNDITDDICFDEHDFFVEEYKKDVDEQYNFNHHLMMLSRYSKSVKDGLKLIRKQEQLDIDYNRELEKHDKALKARENAMRSHEDAKRQLNQIREEFAEKVFKWNDKNTHLKINRSLLSSVTEMIYHYGERYRFDQAISPARDGYEEIRNSYNADMSALIGKKELIQEELDLKYKELDELKNTKDPEPKRDQYVTKNRQRLMNQGIAHIPLYKAIDFSGDVDDSIKGDLEEALERLGILDALVIDPKDRETVLAMDSGESDCYIFSDPAYLSLGISEYLKPDKNSDTFDNSIIDDILKSILLDDVGSKWYVSENGRFGNGLLHGKTSGKNDAKFIGSASRKKHKENLISIKNSEIDDLLVQVNQFNDKIDSVSDMLLTIKSEWEEFPNDVDLSVAYDEFVGSRLELDRLKVYEERCKEESEAVYIKLKDIKVQVIESTKSIYLKRTVEAYEKAVDYLMEYGELLQSLISLDQKRWFVKSNLVNYNMSLEEQLTNQDDVRYDISALDRKISNNKLRTIHIEDELRISGFEEIQSELAQCRERLKLIPVLLGEKIETKALVSSEIKKHSDEIDTLTKVIDKENNILEIFTLIYEEEHKLGYVAEYDFDITAEANAKKMNDILSGAFSDSVNLIDLNRNLIEKINKDSGELTEYSIIRVQLFRDIKEKYSYILDEASLMYIERSDITGKIHGKSMKFNQLSQWIDSQIEEQSSILEDRDREIFEEILIKNISRKISAKIYNSEKWVSSIDKMMESMDNSGGLTFNLKWVPREAQTEEELSTKELVRLLRGDQGLLTDADREKIIIHFKSKIKQCKNKLEDSVDSRGFLSIMKEILDYRRWFDFQLFFTKKGERKRELTNNAFFTFSGGEKAMAMYVPLFSAVNAKYKGGAPDCPKVISLDEAFAGVDEKNIKDMFRLMIRELDLSFIANSQVLYGDYETVPELAIYEILRPENATFVTLIRYKWNGIVRSLITSEDEGDERYQ